MMPEIWYISKEKQAGMSVDEVIKSFNSINDLSEIKNLVAKSTERLFVGWASVEAKDKDGELIPIQDIIKEHSELLATLPAITDSHTNSIVGKTLAFKVMTHPITKTTGVLQLNQIFKRNSKEDQVWKETVDGTRKGLSVGGIADNSKSQYDKSPDGSFVKVLSGFKQFETASCHDPCNPYATIEATSTIAKSNSKMVEENKETKKMDENDMSNSPQEASIDVNELAKVLQSVVERLNEIESAISGGPESENKMEESDEDKPNTEPKEEKKAEDKKEEDDKEDDEKKPETEDKKKESVVKEVESESVESSELSDLKKEMSELKKSNEELKEQVKISKDNTVAEVIKGDRPAINPDNVNKVESKSEVNPASLVAKGEMTSKQAISMRLNQ